MALSCLDWFYNLYLKEKLDELNSLRTNHPRKVCVYLHSSRTEAEKTSHSSALPRHRTCQMDSEEWHLQEGSQAEKHRSRLPIRLWLNESENSLRFCFLQDDFKTHSGLSFPDSEGVKKVLENCSKSKFHLPNKILRQVFGTKMGLYIRGHSWMTTLFFLTKSLWNGHYFNSFSQMLLILKIRLSAS